MLNHNNSSKSGGHKGMMRMMILCLLLFGVLFLGGGKLSSSGYLWPILIGIFVVAHIWMMFRHGGHRGHGDDNIEDKSDTASGKQPDSSKDEHKHGGCCR